MTVIAMSTRQTDNDPAKRLPYAAPPIRAMNSHLPGDRHRVSANASKTKPAKPMRRPAVGLSSEANQHKVSALTQSCLTADQRRGSLIQHRAQPNLER